MGVMDSALVYYTKSLEANKLIESQKGIAISYNAIGKIYLHYGKFQEAYDLINQALAIDIELGDKKFIADSYINLGRAYIALNKTDKAEKSSYLALDIAQEIGSITHTQWAFENLSEIYSKKNNPTRAFYYFKMASKYKDSLINEKNTRAIAMMEVMFDSEKKEKEIQILKQTQEINQKELARQKVIRNFYLAGFIFALDVKRKANRVLAQQKNEIEKSHLKLSLQQNEILNQNQEIEIQRNSIEQKNKYLEDAYKVIEGYIGKITDSIRYAERIQNAILPPVSISKDFFTDYFSLYKPKDFVSGDFYWLTVKENTLFVAVGDCTGHGVPGAFMSIIGMDLLSQAINQQNIVEPSAILDFLNIELRNKLRKEDEEELILKDSMDLAVFTLDLDKNILVYSGALVPLTIIRNKKILEFKPDFTSIGTSTKLFKRPFNQQSIEIKTGDWIYLYSDGFMDQFGGEENKKFMRKRFFDALNNLSSTSGENQKSELTRIFNDWKGNGEQIDDVLVLGLKV
jgi:serine phosphatase RsbU (regulator of sigma subunit)